MKESESEVFQACLTLCDSMDGSPQGFSIHGIFQARILEWVAISTSRRSSWPRDQTQVTALQADFLLSKPQGKPQRMHAYELFYHYCDIYIK